MGSPFMASSGLRYPGPHPEQLAEKYQRSKVVKSRFQAAAHEEDLTATQHRDFSLSHEQTPLTCLGSKVVWIVLFHSLLVCLWRFICDGYRGRRSFLLLMFDPRFSARYVLRK